MIRRSGRLAINRFRWGRHFRGLTERTTAAKTTAKKQAFVGANPKTLRAWHQFSRPLEAASQPQILFLALRAMEVEAAPTAQAAGSYPIPLQEAPPGGNTQHLPVRGCTASAILLTRGCSDAGVAAGLTHMPVRGFDPGVDLCAHEKTTHTGPTQTCTPPTPIEHVCAGT